MKILRIFAISLVLAVVALAADKSWSAEVEVRFSDRFDNIRADIDRSEQRLEQNFRRYSSDRRGIASRRLARARFSRMRWAGAELIGESENYTVENLVRAMVTSNLEQAAIGTEGRIYRVTLDNMGLARPALGALSRNRGFVSGRIEYLDAATGNVLQAADINANLVVSTILDTSYEGPDLAFLDSDASKRVGPALAYFVMRALEKIHPETRFRRPVVIAAR